MKNYTYILKSIEKLTAASAPQEYKHV